MRNERTADLDEDSDLDDVRERWRARRTAAASRRNILIGVAVAAVFLVACGAVVIAVAWGKVGQGAGPLASVVGPSASREGETWTHRELFEHLKAKGVVVELEPVYEGGPLGVPAANLKMTDGKTVLVLKEPSTAAAKDGAALDQKRTWNWGRFFFKSKDPVAIVMIQNAMR